MDENLQGESKIVPSENEQESLAKIEPIIDAPIKKNRGRPKGRKNSEKNFSAKKFMNQKKFDEMAAPSKTLKYTKMFSIPTKEEAILKILRSIEECRACKNYNAQASFFKIIGDWLGWRSPEKIEHTGKDGAPLLPQYDLSKLSDDDLLIIKSKLSVATISIPAEVSKA